MDWKKKVEQGLKTGVESSKKLFEKAREKARDIGDYGVLSLEVKQLQSRHDDLVAKLGSVTFHLLEVEGRSSVSSRTPEIKELISGIASTSEMLASKREAMNRSEHRESEEGDEAREEPRG